MESVPTLTLTLEEVDAMMTWRVLVALLGFLMCFASLASDGVEPESVPDPVPLEYTDVVSMEGASKEQLYERAELWFVDTFVDANEVLQLKDKENGRIVGKGSFQYVPKSMSGSTTVTGPVMFTTKVFAKEGRYKYVLTDFRHEGNPAAPGGAVSFGLVTTAADSPKVGGSKGWRNKKWNEVKAQIEAEVPLIVADLKAAMAEPVDGGDDDDW